MKRILQQSENVPGARSLLLSEQANTEAYFGHFERARELSRTAAGLMQSEGDKEAAGACMAEAAVREAEAGNPNYASTYVSQALQLTHERNAMTLAAVALAISGDLSHAGAISEELNKAYPSATMIQKYWLPTIRAEIELGRGRAENAIHILDETASFEGASLGGLPVITLYPAYVRGQAYLAIGDGNHAAAEFQKFIDNPGLVINFPLHALARLGRARAYSHLSNPARTRLAYQDFLQLWKDADPNLTILQQARMEFASSKVSQH
jgi:eukaryotic-like serine/threonine-protein kinase